MDKTKSTLQKLKPLYSESDQKKLDRLYLLYQSSDWQRQKEIEQTVSTMAARHGLDKVDDQIILPPPSETESDGDISIGKVTYLDRQLFDYKVKLSELTRHTGIFGSTGTGKTTLARQILHNLVKKKIPFIVFDWESSYRGLIKDFPEIKLYTVGREIAPFRFNFFKVPPGLTYQEYLKNVIEVFSKAYVGGVGSDTILLRVFDRAFQTRQLPTLKEMKTILGTEMTPKKMRGRSMLWKESAGRMLEFLDYGGTGQIYNTDQDIEPLLNDFVIFELGGLANSNDKRFFVEILTLWYWLYLEHQGIEDERLKNVLLFEEFHNIVENSKKDDLIQKIFRQLRKYGTGLIALDQTPSLIPNGIFENMSTKITFSLDHQSNIRAVANAMYMEKDQVNFIGLLKVGYAITRSKERYPYPFLLTVPFTGSPAHVKDEEILTHMRQFCMLSSPNKTGQARYPSLPTSPVNEYVPSGGVKILLQEIALKPFIGTDERYKRIGMSSRQGTEFKYKLEEHGYIVPVHADRKLLFELTPKARDYFVSIKFAVPRQARGSIVHNYWLEKIKEQFKAKEGFPFKERNNIDLVVETYDSTYMIQIETGKSNIKKNIETLLKQDCANLIMLATNKEAEIKIRTVLNDVRLPGKEKVQVYFIKDFLSKNPISQSHPKTAKSS